jgi:molecular chaperone DnaJ
MTRDYYAVLGIGAIATAGEIRQAYRRLARQYSPDVNLWDQQAGILFEEISLAYRVLSDPTARSLYDRERYRPSRPDLTGDDRPTRRGLARGDPLHAPVELAFEDAVRGVSVTLEVQRLSPCKLCTASGARSGAARVRCDHCGGTGALWSEPGQSSPEPCQACGGLGERVNDPCPACRGRGIAPCLARVSVLIPPGVDTGAQVRVPEEGHSGPFGGPRGDLIVITRVSPHRFFTRKGDNLYCELPLTITEATLGARIEVPTLDGPVATLIPPGTQNGQVFRIRGKGIPKIFGAGRGDLYVAVRIEIPRGVDSRTEAIFRELERLFPDNPRVRLLEGSERGRAPTQGGDR